MHAFASLLEHGAQIAGTAFVAGLWQGILLAASVWLCLRLASRATAALRFAAWAAVLLLITLLPMLEIVSSRPAERSLFKVDLRWTLALAALWLTGSLLRAASLTWHCYRLWTLHRRAVPLAQPAAMEQLLATNPRKVQICASPNVGRPGVIGFFAPRILIPVWLFPQLTAPELEQVVLHELEHLRRRDDWLNLLQKLALVLFPLNPVLIAVERLLCRERELACDDGVLRRTHAPRLYAACLANLAERGLDHRALSLALGALGDPERPEPVRSELARRIQRILRYQTVSTSRYARALTAALGVVLACGAAGLARCPQLITFVPTTPIVAADVPASPRLLHVVYADAQAVSPRLVSASFSPSGTAHPARVRRQKPARAAQVHLPKQPLAPETPLLLTGWPEQDRPRFLTLSADQIGTRQFTVVRVDGGWLLVQL